MHKDANARALRDDQIPNIFKTIDTLKTSAKNPKLSPGAVSRHERNRSHLANVIEVAIRLIKTAARALSSKNREHGDLFL